MPSRCASASRGESPSGTTRPRASERRMTLSPRIRPWRSRATWECWSLVVGQNSATRPGRAQQESEAGRQCPAYSGNHLVCSRSPLQHRSVQSDKTLIGPAQSSLGRGDAGSSFGQRQDAVGRRTHNEPALYRVGDAEPGIPRPHRCAHHHRSKIARGDRASPCFEKHPRSTVDDTQAIFDPPDVRDFAALLVPRGGIEPPTRGFSVPCSTD